MKTRLFNLLPLFALLVSLVGSAVTVTPAQAAGIVVNTAQDQNNTDTTKCSLREAISAAIIDAAYGGCPAGSGNDKITFAANYIITLNSQLPAVNTTITITGNGAANTVVQASTCHPISQSGGCPPATYRVFEVSSTGNLTLDSLTVQHGNCTGSCASITVSGGGILNRGTLTLTDSTLSGNRALEGGGILNEGTLNVINSFLSSNHANFEGGGIDNRGTLTLTNSTISNNSSDWAGGGINNSNTLITANSTFSDNSSIYSLGGGMYNAEASSSTLTNVTFSDNSANSDGGGMYNAEASSSTLTNVTFSANSANSLGGGMFNDQTSSTTLTNVTFSDNSASSGGGMYNYVSSPMLTNVTFSGNTVNNNGGGMYNYVSSSTLTNVTFSGNSANSGGGMYNFGSGLTLKNVIIANSTGGDCVHSPLSINAASSNNLIESTGANACGMTATSQGGNNIIGSDPNLGSLTGSPAYFPLISGSLAINAGDNAACAAPPANNESQNGISRPQDGTCDIGSYEALVSLTVKSNAANDGWILESSENSNTGGSINSSASNFILGDDAADKQYRAILHFDTSALPDTAVITNMTLKIKQQGSVTGTSPFSFGSLYVDMRNPAFGGSALELADFNSTAKKVKSAIFNSTPVSGWFSARFNTGGNLYVNRTGSTQLRLYFSVDDNDNNIADFIRFFSGDAAAGDRPKLLITYYVP